jgi:hypothetical protein
LPRRDLVAAVNPGFDRFAGGESLRHSVDNPICRCQPSVNHEVIRVEKFL